MCADDANRRNRNKRIVVIKNGPYSVEGDIPLISKTQVVSELGEPLTWQKDGEIATSVGEYHLCRCGQSGNLPFCDGTHRKVEFDGAETAVAGPAELRRFRFPDGVARDAIEAQLALAIVAAECFFGKPKVRISAAYLFPKRSRELVIDVGTEVGEHIAQVFAGLLTRQVGEDRFTVDRVTSTA